MELKLQRKKLRLDVYGTKVELRPPTIDEADHFQEELEAADPRGLMRIMRKYLVDHGFPESLLGELETDDLSEVLELLGNPRGKMKAQP